MRVFRLTFEKAVVIFEICNLILSPKKKKKKKKKNRKKKKNPCKQNNTLFRCFWAIILKIDWYIGNQHSQIHQTAEYCAKIKNL